MLLGFGPSVGELIVARVVEVHMTGLPRPHDEQAAKALRVERAQFATLGTFESRTAGSRTASSRSSCRSRVKSASSRGPEPSRAPRR